MKVAAQVLFHAKSSPDRPALAYAGGVATYGMIGRAICSVCAHLRQQDLPPHGIVAMDIRDPFQHVALILAAELCGLTSLSVTTRHELDSSGLKVDALLVDEASSPHPSIQTVRVESAWFALAPNIDIEPNGVPDDRYYRIILSSGTTGRPKAVGYKPPLIGRFMLRQCLMRAESTPRNLSMIGLPTLGVLNPLFALAQGGLASFARSNEEALSVIRTFGITRLGYATATQIEALVATARQSSDTCPSLQVIHVSGSRLPSAIAAEARARLCNNIVTSYASTEVGILSYGRVGAPNEPEGSAGFVLPWVEIEVRDEQGRALPHGSTGHLHVRSPDVAEYVDPADRIRTDTAGWFEMGDVGYLRQDGLLVIEGRATEVINSSGLVVAPEYVEEVLVAQPGIREAAVFVHTNAAGIEEIWAAVVPEGMINKEQILAACRPLLGDKLPKRLEILASLPRTENGKLRRDELRQLFATAP